jgi:hypothetical protein
LSESVSGVPYMNLAVSGKPDPISYINRLGF